MWVVARDEPTKTLYVRVTPGLKDQVNEYARELDITLNAAVTALLDEGLQAVKNRTEKPHG